MPPVLGYRSDSSRYMRRPNPTSLRFCRHSVARAAAVLWESDGSSRAARMAMMAITTSSSIKVKAGGLVRSEMDSSGGNSSGARPAFERQRRLLLRRYANFLTDISILTHYPHSEH